MVVNRAGSLLAASAAGERATGRQAWQLLWRSSRGKPAGVIGWVAAGAVLPPLVVIALGQVVGRIPPTVSAGFDSPAGHSLVAGWCWPAGVRCLTRGGSGGYRARHRGARPHHRCPAGAVAGAVSGPVGIDHLEDQDVLDKLARAEGRLGHVPRRCSGHLGRDRRPVSPASSAASSWPYRWWLGLGLLVMWIVVRRVMLRTVVRQATELRGQTTAMRRAWYFIGVGSKARDAKELRVFGLGRFRRRAVSPGKRRRWQAASGLRGCTGRAWLLARRLRRLRGRADLRSPRPPGPGRSTCASLAMLLPMLAVTVSVGSVSFDDITLAWTLAGLPDVDTLEATCSRDTPSCMAGAVGRPTARSARCASSSVSFATRTARDVLTGVDLDLVPAGTSTAIVGRQRGREVDAGEPVVPAARSDRRTHHVDGVDVRELDAAQWQRTVAIMPQEPVRYPLRAYDNIALGAIEHADDREGWSRRAVGWPASPRSCRPCRTAGTPCSSRELPGGVDLSGGQWQRLALARALFATRHGARLLVLDEPTAALDVRSEARFYSRFLEITAGLTTVVISHRFATVRRADRICVLDGGRITETGSHDELVAVGGAYAAAYAVQAARFGRAERAPQR